MDYPLDLLSIGDTTLDIFLDIEEASVNCQIDTENCKLLLNFADKIPVKKLTRIPGVGNAANNAVGGARLGLKTALYSILGNDKTAEEIKQRLIEEGVFSDYLATDKEHGTNTSVVLNFRVERTILVYHEPRTYVLPDTIPARWIYLTSVAQNHDQLHADVLTRVARDGSQLGFNPGTYQLKEGLPALTELFAHTHALFLNKEEAQRLVGEIDDMKELIHALHASGQMISAITDGPEGAYAFDGTTLWHQPILEVPIVERTGSGDAFGTGFMAALMHGNDIPEALRWGTCNSASVIQYIGAQEGLLTKEKMDQMLAEHPELQPTILE